MLDILQIIISVVVIYIIFSVVVFFIVEWTASVIQLRGKMLRNAVLDLFRSSDLGKAVYHHPLVESLRAPNNKLASYIPSSSFATALIDIITSPLKKTVTPATPDVLYADFLNGIAAMPEGRIKTLLNSLTQEATDLKSLTASLEKWYNDCMDRISGWYKREVKVIVIIVSAILTIAFNIDTIYIIIAAKENPELRQRLNNLGDQILADSAFAKQVSTMNVSDIDYFEDYTNDSSVQATNTDTAIHQSQDQNGPIQPNAIVPIDERLQKFTYLHQLLGDSEVPIGWPIQKGWPWYYTLLGWFFTTLALSAGAPFWFDILKKLVNLRSTGPKPVSNI